MWKIAVLVAMLATGTITACRREATQAERTATKISTLTVSGMT